MQNKNITPVYIVCVVYQGILDSVEYYFSRAEARSKYAELRSKYESDADADVSFWKPKKEA